MSDANQALSRKRGRKVSHSPGKKRRGMGQVRSAHGFSAETNFLTMPPTLPIAVLEEVFMNVPARELVCVCRLVCRQWKEVVDSTSLWRNRCRREGYELRNASSLPKDWRQFYFLCKKRRNLLKNPRAEGQFSGWNILEDGGDKWKIEDVSQEHLLPDETVKKYFVTSYTSCMKCQLIDLVKEGYGPAFMDEVQPDIIVSDWYSPRWDCGCVYNFSVELLNQKKKVIREFHPDPVYFEQWNDMQWKQMKHVFHGYGPGVRFIRFTHGGKDTQFWAGWYGIRVTNSSVEISPSGDR
ncbi:F-box only protein 6-like isoform X1 [Scleropages formosus]|uniref:F-box only protein 6-like n=2 Tax=Scleropages formosus TaxID=113540 RepID=A0A8C9RV42_SCLFO|nr:F-box only protein 6-like isoform X1 [Scleropages formosus]XP_018617708.1 F-box only protein 6-like isoform X1 [Scleropages formosus]XP_018617709.1 F-box only protein 6-like isoform X1 [Scleropages formosus]XP_018617717.1 F-box only protein 6-like isoform X1 [Scleropages formosus]